MEAGGILLSGNNTTRLGQFLESLIDKLDVFLLELMMVRERKRSEVLGVGSQVVDNLLWGGDACQQ